jgi:long-chain-fatty-acid--CoA ligase ACSBG
VGLYPTNSSSVNKFILEDCKANILLVEEEKGVNKILEMKNELPDLKKIVQVIFLS